MFASSPWVPTWAVVAALVVVFLVVPSILLWLAGLRGPFRRGSQAARGRAWGALVLAVGAVPGFWVAWHFFRSWQQVRFLNLMQKYGIEKVISYQMWNDLQVPLVVRLIPLPLAILAITAFRQLPVFSDPAWIQIARFGSVICCGIVFSYAIEALLLMW
ncbi:MAG: hypothetical protein R3C49_20760 [Planctomycetaceae bacterium]